MSPPDVKRSPRTHGDVLTAISKGMVGLLREFYGHGPTRAKTYYQDDLVVCMLRDGFTRVEQTLLEGGRGDSAPVVASLPKTFANPAAWSATLRRALVPFDDGEAQQIINQLGDRAATRQAIETYAGRNS